MPESTASMRSSPSHQPVALPPLSRGSHGLRRRERSQDLRRRAKVRPPPRVESTQPRDTSPELSSGEETAGESTKVGEHSSDPLHYAPRPARWDESADDEDEADVDDGEWIDEDVGGMEGIADDLLQLEFHTDYVGNAEKRRRRWKLRWEALLRAVSAPLSLRDRFGRSDPVNWALIPHHHHSSMPSIARLILPSCCSPLLLIRASYIPSRRALFAGTTPSTSRQIW
jgi:hypothetical protein